MLCRVLLLYSVLMLLDYTAIHRMYSPHRSTATWPQALSLQAHPAALPTSLTQLATIVDDIWRAAGDTSTDSNWYTKRALLAGVYTTTELYMLTDGSPGFADTWESLQRRVDDVVAAGKTLRQVGGQFEGLLQTGNEVFGRVFAEALGRAGGVQKGAGATQGGAQKETATTSGEADEHSPTTTPPNP